MCVCVCVLIYNFNDNLIFLYTTGTLMINISRIQNRQ